MRGEHKRFEVPPERRGLRRFPRLLIAATRFVWEADRRRLVISMLPPLVTAVMTAWQLLLTRDLIAAVLTPTPSGDPGHIVPPLVGMITAGTISTLANVFNTQQQQIEGRIVESGTHRELMTQGGRYAELFTMQAAAYFPELERASVATA